MIFTMDTAPRDGTRILLQYALFTWRFGREGYPLVGDGMLFVGHKWEEMRWDKTRGRIGFTDKCIGAWTPWEGAPNHSSTHTVNDFDAVGWIPVPE